MRKLIEELYPNNIQFVCESIQKLIKKYKINEEKIDLSEKDSMLITYGDSILDENNVPLNVLNEFLQKHVGSSLSAVHLLPMFPYTSDDGFSVVDYLKVNPALGNWENIRKLSNSYNLMFDAVINHISKSSNWFKKYQSGDNEFNNFFIECNEYTDYSTVVRPRSLPLYYKYNTSSGEKLLWATFSEDQLDINYQNPRVFLKVLEVLLEYAKRGARFIRFDAIGFIWKKAGTSCIHLKETHLLVKLMRLVLSESFPNTRIISETNVPHKENISYFGNGYDEAHLVYQFPLPPLTLFSFLVGNATKLMEWAESLKYTHLTSTTTYFNFLASHDGIGLRPIEGILTEEEKDIMVENTLKKGGRIGYKNNPDGTKSPYELNINYLSALTEPESSIKEKTQIFMASQCILLSLQGIPGIYIHSLLGSVNDIKGMQASNINRRINREKLDLKTLEEDLKNPSMLRSNVFYKYLSLLKIRKNNKAFSPLSKQEVVFFDERVFSIIRYSEKSKEKVLVLVNVSSHNILLETSFCGRNLITNEQITGKLNLKPYEFVWIKSEGKK